MSTNHKDIGTLYLTFSMCAGLLGGTMSVLMRYNLMTPGGRLFGADHVGRRGDDARMDAAFPAALAHL